MSISGFYIYNASAGSGKTFTLVKTYLKILLASKNPLYFKHLLALTFTNKAVNEMKSRILNTLLDFSKIDTVTSDSQMFGMLIEELDMDADSLQAKSKRLLEFILHNYASFDVSTIDKFNHRLIRTFAHDLKIPANFEVEIDQESLLNQAVDNLIQRAGEDEELTKLLVEFSIEKADDDKSWDISFDFNKIAKLLVNENHNSYVDGLSEKSIKDFNALKSNLTAQRIALETKITTKAEEVLQLIDEAGLEHSDFLRGSLPKHFLKILNKEFNIDFEKPQWMQKLDSEPLYPKSTTSAIAQIIDAIQPQLVSAFNATKALIYEHKFVKAIYKNSTPLSVLTAINKELQILKDDENLLLISEFNNIISQEIKEQPTPYIYERLGEKYKHYFIDEFQDTSKLQWQNLQPLVSNALEQEYLGEQGSLMLVGDAKQAIYRWRGGYAEQFIDLSSKTDIPFSVEQIVKVLGSNFRSSKSIVEFNNEFFKFLSKDAFSYQSYQQLYESASQNITSEDEGYVNLRFLDIGKNDIKEDIYTEEVFKIVNTCLNVGYQKRDIAILVRRKTEGLEVSEHLQAHGIAIQSSETMLLKNSNCVLLINDFLNYIIEPENTQIKVNVLHGLATYLNIEDKHAYLKERTNLNPSEFFESLSYQASPISIVSLKTLDLFNLTETLIRSFINPEDCDAYIQDYLNVVFEYHQKKGSDIKGFLEYFEKKQNDLAIASTDSQDAIKILTIHKSKGLEFPVVIFPFADLDIYREKEAKEWMPLDANRYNGFDYALLNFNKDFEYFNEYSAAIHKTHTAALELDNINLLYVALTRAEEQLFVVSKKELTKDNKPNQKTYAGKLIAFLQQKGYWSEDKTEYSFGDSISRKGKSSTTEETVVLTNFISNDLESQNISIVTKSGLIWDTQREESIVKGNLIHGIMALVKTSKDLPFALNSFLEAGKIGKEQHQELNKILMQLLNHPLLKSYYSEDNRVYNERDIISTKGEIFRPDRITINNRGGAAIIDYKSGAENNHHINQLLTYEELLEQMDISVEKKILVYINDDIYVKEI